MSWTPARVHTIFIPSSDWFRVFHGMVDQVEVRGTSVVLKPLDYVRFETKSAFSSPEPLSVRVTTFHRRPGKDGAGYDYTILFCDPSLRQAPPWADSPDGWRPYRTGFAAGLGFGLFLAFVALAVSQWLGVPG